MLPVKGWLFGAFYAALLTSCGEAQLGGGGGTVQTPTTSGGGDQAATSKESPSDPATSGEQSDDEAVAQCLEKFGNHPFGTSWKGHYRKMAASVQVLGFGSAASDLEATDAPSLVLISAAVSVLGSPKYELLNPHGWYCIKVGVNVKTSLDVQLACDAHLADNRVQVGVLSDSEATTAVGVDVLSKVKLTRVGACN